MNSDDKKQREQEKREKKAEVKKQIKKESEKRKQDLERMKLIMPLGVRVGNIAIGTIFVALATFIILSTELATDIAISFFGMILFVSGAIRIINAFYTKQMGGTKRMIWVVLGIFIITIGMISLVFQNLGEEILILIVAIGLILQGINRVFLSITHNLLPTWTRTLLLAVGVFSVIIAIVVFFKIQDTVDILVTLLAYAFFFGGWSRMGFGLSGIRKKPPNPNYQAF